ncbi:DapH/DapD/GlmU-related protein [Paenibacillus sp. GCM10023252]|uniref:acyltransferase n=1 Tax=Paenibacillus sp. GCM10023252 TaxID=3252649 RepID=UPI00360D907F
MRGRDLFSKFQIPLRLMEVVFGLMPRPLLKWLWALSDGLPDIVGIAFRYGILRRLAARCGNNVLVGRSVELRYPERLTIGSNVSIHKQCYLDAYGGMTIEDDVSIAHQSSLISFQHTWSDESLPIRDNPVTSAPIRIGRDVWIGCGVRVMAGVDIGQRSVVAAGAVVTKSVTPGSIAAGVPARVVKRIAGTAGSPGRGQAPAGVAASRAPVGAPGATGLQAAGPGRGQAPTGAAASRSPVGAPGATGPQAGGPGRGQAAAGGAASRSAAAAGTAGPQAPAVSGTAASRTAASSAAGATPQQQAGNVVNLHPSEGKATS